MKLIIEDDEGRKTIVPIVHDEVEITIGRQEGNTIRLTERNVSRRHAKLTRRLGHVLIEDLDSYNGIKVNGDRINGASEIKEGDLVQIGDYDLAIEDDGRLETPDEEHAGSNVETALSPVPESLDSVDSTTPTPPLRRPTPARLARLRSAPPDTPVGPARPFEDEEHELDETPPLRSPGPERRRPSNGALRASQPATHTEPGVEEIAPEDAPRLILTTSELAGREFACIRSELSIGRTNDNDIAIEHRSISQNHCKLVREEGHWRVFDLQSVNGIKINGEPCEESPLRYGDTLELGHLRFSFLAPGEEPTPPATELSPLAAPAPNKLLPILIAIGLVILAILLVAIYFKMRRRPAEPASVGVEAVPPQRDWAQLAPEGHAAPLPELPRISRSAPPSPPEARGRAHSESAEESRPPFDVPHGAASPRAPPAELAKPPSHSARAEGAKPPPAAAKAEGTRRGPAGARATGAAKEASLRDLEQAESLKRLGKFKEALPFFLNAVREDPDLEVAHFDLAVTLAKTGQYGEAAREFQYFADHFPDSPKAEIAQTNAREYRQRMPDLPDSPKADAPRESGADHPQRPDL
jgi:pSer/pThr/pTyr-binding forkhead associated (FHA) protein